MKNYLVTLVVFFLIDIVWLAFIGKNFYQNQIGFLMKSSPNWIAALIFYALFIMGLLFFVVNPSLEKDSIKYAITAGMLFGLITYSTYDLTNLATIQNWPLKVTIVDMIWGTFLTGSVSTISHLILKKF